MLLSRDDEHMMTAEELRLRRQKRRRLVLVLLLVLVLGLGTYFGGRPARNAIKSWQARRHAAKAFALIEQQKWTEAKDAAVAAYQLRNTEPQALRAVARFLSRTRQQQALEFWDQLAKQQPLTREDRYDEAVVALTSGEIERAATIVDQLLAGDGKDAAPRDWLVAAQLHLQQGAPDRALDSLSRFFALPESTPREAFQASVMQLQAARTADMERNSREQSEAWQRLADFARRDDGVGLDALVLLAQQQLATHSGVEAGVSPATPDIDQAATSVVQVQGSHVMPPQELIRRLETHPLARAPQKLLAIDLELRAKPEEKDALIRRAITDWKDSDPAQVAVLATWLNGRGAFEQTLAVVPIERAVQSRELFLQHVDALGALGRWDEIKRLLDAERFPLDPVIQHMYLARCNAQLGQEAASKNNWQRALEAAAGDLGKLMTLAEYAEKNGAADTAAAAYSQAVAAAPKVRAAWQGKLRIAYANRDTKRIHEVLAQMLARWPNDTAIQNDEAYVRLLLLANDDPANPELIQIEKLAERLVAKSPTSLPNRTLLALARLKQSRPVAALQVYDGIQVSPKALTPSALAVHASVLAANGQNDDARQAILQISSNALLPEEQAGTANLRE